MRQERRRRGMDGGAVPGAPRRSRVGEPNVLSDAATPNVLSTQTGRPKLLGGPTEPATFNRPQPNVVPNHGWLATGQAAPAPRVRLPSVGTLIFLVFVAITAVRLLGEFASGIAIPTAAPVATTPPEPAASVAPGPITFGSGQGADCAVTGVTAVFDPNADVWWSAELSTVQPPEASAVVVVRRAGEEVHRELVPPDPSFGEWSVLCAGEPIRMSDPGVYRVEVWNKEETVLHAAGEYRIRAS